MALRAGQRLGGLKEQGLTGIDRSRRSRKRIGFRQEVPRSLRRFSLLRTDAGRSSARYGSGCFRRAFERGLQIGDHVGYALLADGQVPIRSEERRVGKEGRS